MGNTQTQLSSVTSLTDVLQLYKKVIKREIKALTLAYYSKRVSEFDSSRGFSIDEVKPFPYDKNQSDVKYWAYNFDQSKTFTANEIIAVGFTDMDFRDNVKLVDRVQKENQSEIYHSENYGVIIPLKTTGSGSSDFDTLTNRPKYKGVDMTHETNIPEVKTNVWDAKLSDAPSDDTIYGRKNGSWVEVDGEPSAYIKSASVSAGTLTLTKKDDTTVAFSPVAFNSMDSTWTSSSLTTQSAATAMINSSSTVDGQAYLGTVHWTDLPASMGAVEVRAYVISKSSGIILFEASSADTSPYNWVYNSWYGGVKSWIALSGSIKTQLGYDEPSTSIASFGTYTYADVTSTTISGHKMIVVVLKCMGVNQTRVVFPGLTGSDSVAITDWIDGENYAWYVAFSSSGTTVTNRGSAAHTLQTLAIIAID